MKCFRLVFFLIFLGMIGGMGTAVQSEIVQKESEEARKVRLDAKKLENRKLWKAWTVGENLALGKRVLLVPEPDYRLTVREGTDPEDLTDGVLSTAHWDRLWFDSKCVGWYGGKGLERFIRIDLGCVQPVARAVIRCLGGTGHNFRFPQKFEVWVSRDGIDYFLASSMEKLMPCESAQADWERFFYLEETAPMYETQAFPFSLKIQADARFVLLKITGATASVFSDELVILKAEGSKTQESNAEETKAVGTETEGSNSDGWNLGNLSSGICVAESVLSNQKSADFNAAYASVSRKFPLSGLVISTRWHELGIVRGMCLPQHFQLMDLREVAGTAENASAEKIPGEKTAEGNASRTECSAELVLELPRGVSVSAGNADEIPSEWQNVSGVLCEGDLPQSAGGTGAAGELEAAGVPNRECVPYFRFVFPLPKRGTGFQLPTLYFELDETVRPSETETDRAADGIGNGHWFEEEEKIPPAKLYARVNGVDQFATILPIRAVALPEFPPYEKLHVSLAWMGEREQRVWPDFFRNYRRLGFNAVPTFPRYWPKDDAQCEPMREYLRKARKAGFRVVMNESPLHVMMGRKDAGHEIYCQPAEGEPGKDLCPTYRGEFYAAEMERVAQCVERTSPDFVFFDIECWHSAENSSKKCERCRAAWEIFQKSQAELGLREAEKMSEAEMRERFLLTQGREIVRDLHDAVHQGAQRAQIPVPVIGSYARQPIRPVYAIEHFRDTYPEFIDMAMPSLYIAGRERDVHKNIRENHELLGNSRLIPWLSAGCYGEFEPEKLEFLVLESLLNGAGGITYYCFDDFDTPLDFYAHARALAVLRPYEDLLVSGRSLNISGSNPDLLYSAWGTKKEMLLLIGNPDRAEEETVLSLVSADETISGTCVKDLRSGKTETVVSPGDFTCTVPKGGVRLFYISRKR